MILDPKPYRVLFFFVLLFWTVLLAVVGVSCPEQYGEQDPPSPSPTGEDAETPLLWYIALVLFGGATVALVTVGAVWFFRWADNEPY